MTDPVVLFEDNHCLAVAKPGGLLTQGVPQGRPTLEAWAREYLRTKYTKAGRVYLGIPHRLDRPVSGVILFARSSKAAARLAEQFRERQVTKVYRAAVDGAVEPVEGTWDDSLRKVPDEARAEVVPADAPGARAASLRYRVLARIADGTLLQLTPVTGRSHQLRVQSAARGWPIRGDRLYGSAHDFGPPAATDRDRRIALHAESLTFLHPIRYEPVTVTAAVPAYWAELGAGR
jgi:23S rRNA pseudouridine1911/1915/1917 synthase